jgi:hypothetical protein
VAKRRPGWQPTKVVRFIKNLPSGAGTILVETDEGTGYLKAMGNPGGEHCLACEYVGTRLAQWFGLSTFNFTLINVTEVDELPFAKGGTAKPGPAFVTKKEVGNNWGGTERELNKLVNPDDITLLVIFDTWVLNWDRYSTTDVAKPRINRDNVFLSEEGPPGKFLLKAMDHTHCFTRSELTSKMSNLDKVRDSRVYGLFPEFLPFLDKKTAERGVRKLRAFNKTEAANIVQSIPTEWDVTDGARKALIEFLVSRAAYLVQSIMTMLWPQGDLAFTDEGEEQS